MVNWVKALAAALIVPLALAACLFVPGKFESTLDIRADRSFTFAYKGEIQALDLKQLSSKAMESAMEEDAEEDEDSGEESKDPAVFTNTALSQTADKKDPEFALTPAEKAARDAEYRELATQIAKEAGYRSVEYRGNGLFYIDYAISGRLSHGFAFPYNQDAEMVFPFVVIELRGKDAVRVKAPGFAEQDSSGAGGGAMGAMSEGMSEGMGKAMGFDPARMAGTFTLTTDAEIVSQNQEDGARASGGGKTIVWKVNHRTKEAPMAVLRVAGL